MQSPVDSRRVEQNADAARPVGKRSAAGRGASVSRVPDGNHGDNLHRTHSGVLPLPFIVLFFASAVFCSIVGAVVDRMYVRVQDLSYRTIAEECVRALK
jgi:hypothetical protein